MGLLELFSFRFRVRQPGAWGSAHEDQLVAVFEDLAEVDGGEKINLLGGAFDDGVGHLAGNAEFAGQEVADFVRLRAGQLEGVEAALVALRQFVHATIGGGDEGGVARRPVQDGEQPGFGGGADEFKFIDADEVPFAKHIAVVKARGDFVHAFDGELGAVKRLKEAAADTELDAGPAGKLCLADAGRPDQQEGDGIAGLLAVMDEAHHARGDVAGRADEVGGQLRNEFGWQLHNG